MSEIILILMLAVIVEYLVNIVKNLLPETDYPLPLVIGLVIGLGLAFTVQLDILAAFGFETVYKPIGYAVTGLVAAGGSAAVHELISKLRASRDDIDEDNYS